MTFTRQPPGLRETFVDDGSNIPLEDVSFYYSFLNDTTKAVIEEIRRYFQTNPRTGAYRWQGIVRENGEVETAPQPDSKIHISVEHPDQAKRWPYVMVREVSGNMRDLWLGQRMGTIVAPNPNYSSFDAAESEISGANYNEPKTIDVGERLGGKMDFRVTLAIGAVGVGARAECNVVTDLVLHGLVLPLRRAWYRRSLNWQPDSGAITSESMTSLQGMERDKECVRTITFGLQIEWYDDFYFIADTVEAVDLKRAYLVGNNPRSGV